MELNLSRILFVSYLTLFTFTFTFTFSPISSIDLQEGVEMDCMQPHPTVARNVDYAWMHSISRWYIPLQNKLNYFRYSESLLQQPLDNLTQSDLDLSKSCMTYRWGSPSPKLFGYEDKTTTFAMGMVIENTFSFKGTSALDKVGRSYITFRDNKSFVFFITCWEGGQGKPTKASWYVISTNKTMDADAKKSVLDHAKSLGFKDEFIIEQSYEGCPEISEDKPNMNKSEL